MDNEKIKQMLLDICPTELDFTVTQSGKESKRVNGLYKPDTHEIILHNKNFNTEAELVYTAIHEYTHHLIAEEQLELNGKEYMPNAKVHTDAFWAKFHSLLKVAEEKKYYSIDISVSPELEELTKKIQTEYLEVNGKLMQEFGRLLIRAQMLCDKANIRYEDYVDRVLKLPRNSERDIKRVGRIEANPSLGYDNLKMVTAIKKPEDRKTAEEQLLEGESPVSVRAMMKQKSRPESEDKRSKLEKEKNRLAKTIAQLQQRLDYVEESLANM
ncbi:MAG: hypothetical protein MJ169_06190 [Treponema sp.]|nr:hypothetical protein [Treponema sp.]